MTDSANAGRAKFVQHRPASRPNLRKLCGAIEAIVAASFAVSARHLRRKTRGVFLVAFARQSAMYLAHVAFGFSYTDIGCGFGRHRTTAAYACRLIEEHRDDPAIDALLSTLETACHALRDRLACDGEVRS